MSATEFPPPLPSRGAPIEQGHRDPALAGVVSDLYRACHLPPPAILIARCGDEFVQLLAMTTFRPALALGPLLFALSCPCLFLAMFTLVWIAGTQDRLGTGLGDVLFALYLGIFAPVMAAFASRLPLRMPFRPGLVHSLLLYGMAAVGSAGVVLMLGGVLFFVLFAALAATACAILLHFTGLLLWARWWRWRFGAAPPWGDHAVHNVIGPRLSSAADHVNSSRTSGPGPRRARRRNETPAITASMQAEAERLDWWVWHDNGPLLGPAAGYAAVRRACVASVDRVADLSVLPVVLRAAAEIDARVDAASFFAKTAVLLPADSALTLAEAPGAERASARRSCRSPYRQVLAAVNAGPVARWMIDLAPSQALAKRLLVRLILRLEDATRRQTAIHAMGEGAFIEAARLRPMQSDEFGDLYLIGPQQNPLAFVKVRDASPGPDGVHREHWLSVPPHVATAREAVAWTFGLSEKSYAPVAET